MQDVPVSAPGVFNIPPGTATADLLYQICSEEYPEYVSEQSQFNDVWTLSAEDISDNLVVNATASVNEMLFSPPTWQPYGCTAVIDVPITFIHPKQPNTVTIDASSLNIGDSALTTTMQVIVVPSATFSVSLTLDPPPNVVQCPTSPAPHAPNTSADTSNITVCKPSKGDYFSIPLPCTTDEYDSLKNTVHRPATAKLIHDPSAAVAVDNVELDLVDLSGTILQILYQGPLGTVVKQTETDMLKLDLSFGVDSTLSDRTTIPDRIQFNLIVTGTQNGSGASGKGTSPVFNTLLPATSDATVAGLVRYPQSWLGGSDWTKNATINCMAENATKLTRFNDISGEHGRYVGHKTYNFGNAIDIFHFSPLATSSGGVTFSSRTVRPKSLLSYALSALTVKQLKFQEEDVSQ